MTPLGTKAHLNWNWSGNLVPSNILVIQMLKKYAIDNFRIIFHFMKIEIHWKKNIKR